MTPGTRAVSAKPPLRRLTYNAYVVYQDLRKMSSNEGDRSSGGTPMEMRLRCDAAFTPKYLVFKFLN